MKKSFTLIMLAWVCHGGFSQVSLTAQNGNYSQNFDGMGSPAANTIVSPPTNWMAIRYDGDGTAGAVNEPLSATTSTGSNTGGTIYNAGSSGASDRALGTLASGPTVPAFGIGFTNNTGVLLLNLSLSGVSEQWRIASSPVLERVVFEYSLDATSINNGSGTWTAIPAMDLLELQSTPTGALNGNLAANRVAISTTINGLNLPNGGTVWLRWRDINDSGNDGMYALDDFVMNYTSGTADVTPPSIASLTPANGSTTVPANQIFTIGFSEAVQKGAGNIYLKKAADGSTVQTLNVTSAAVSVSGSVASFGFSPTALQTGYYIQADAGTFKDGSNNDFAGISGTAWSFTTDNRYAYFDFNTCPGYGAVPNGFTQYSVVGDSLWKCTSFGRNSTNGVQMNGYVNSTVGNDANEDWLISPAYDFTGATVPLVQFWSISAYIGPSLRLMVSTDYVSGAPSTGTWTEIYGKFPADNSFAWTLSDSINLSGFKQPNVHLAWVYYSTVDEASRWTLDDISFINSAVVPGPYVAVVDSSVNVGYAPFGSAGGWQPVTVNAGNLSGLLTFTSSAPFQLSRDTTAAASNTVNFTPAEANVNSAKQFYVRLAPDADEKNYTGTISTSYSSVNRSIISLFGTSLSPEKTLDIVNWNLEWFGSPNPTLGPTNKDQQFTNVLKILRSIDADIFSLVEVVDTSRFRRLRDSLGNNYGSIVCNYGSYAVNPSNGNFDASIATAQKEGFIYKKSVFSNVTARPFLFTGYNDTITSTDPSSRSSYYWWSSGRFPYLMEADVTLNSQTRHMVFVLLHAKANTGTDAEKRTSYSRRKLGVNNMKDSLDANFSTASIIILGDYNDRLSGTIAPTTAVADTGSSYKAIVIDSTDADSYKSLTLPFVNVGTTASGNSAIDNVIVSNEVAPYYLSNSLQIRKDVTGLVNSYSTTTTDHYPIFSRFYFNQVILPVSIVSFTGTKLGADAVLQWQVAKEVNVEKYVVETSADGRSFTPLGTVAATGSSNYQLTHSKPVAGNHFYRLKSVDKDGKIAYSTIVRLYFGNGWQVTLSPNPVKGILYLQSSKGGSFTVSVYDATGRSTLRFANLQMAASETKLLSVSQLAKGTYTVEVTSGSERIITKLVAE